MSPRLRASGFTLLELMVVLLIIGVMTSFAVLSIGNRTLSDRQDNEAARLQELFRLAQDEALFKRVEIGFFTDEQRYGFLTPDGEGGWQPYTKSGPLRVRPFSEPFRGVLFVEGQAVAPPDPEEPEPAVLILSSGEVTPFRLEIRAPEGLEPAIIRGDALGRLERGAAGAGS
ncbi:type II secretion system minor pseudopilin GspH [Algiphilus sp.]|uniref:type II secretion system minor pseudopilin GspH n=1 Tax=Algiphilus sp. TaxID=1872431 RepID=UPI0025BFBA0D|nr:type II secretion system minor pseudopilin GspH [Algiphilus sp.]MCK5770818.1 type II secretion system minor pseudopilin GspH [Algiphilus sp.]